ESLGVDKILVRSPMTCEAPLGVCRLCYGMDLATNNLVEEGMAVGIIAAQSNGEPGTPPTMPTLPLGRTRAPGLLDPERKAKKAGQVKLENVKVVTNDAGERVALTRKGELHIVGPKDRIQETHSVPHGATLHVEDKQQVQVNQLLFRIDPHRIPILAETGGRVRFEEI